MAERTGTRPLPKRSDTSTKNPNHKGRKSSLTPEVHEAIIEGIKAGNYVSTVMAALGIPYHNFYQWKWKGQPQPVYDDDGNHVGDEYPDNFYGDFARDLAEAEAFAEMKAVKALQSHFDKDWRAAAEYLSRKFPQKWNPKQVVEHSGKDGGPIQVEENKRETLYAQLDQISGSEIEDAEVIEPEALEPGDESQGIGEQLSLDLELEDS